MRRFDDFLKLLLGLLVTQIVREGHTIGKNLHSMFFNSSSLIAEAFPYCLMIFFLRNVHASINYDRAAGNGRFSTILDQSIGGRFLVFLVSIVTLIVAPLVILDLLTWHAPVEASSVSVARDVLIAAMFSPFVLYMVWDTVIWIVSEQTSPTRDHLVVEDAVRRWLWIDAIGLLAGTVFLVRFTTLGPQVDPSERYKYVLELFMGLTLVTVFLDYALNRRFYFPEAEP